MDNLLSKRLIYNDQPKYNAQFETKFNHGLYFTYIDHDNMKITKCVIYSDSLDIEFVNELRRCINGYLPLSVDNDQMVINSYRGPHKDRMEEIIKWLLRKMLRLYL